MTALKIEFCFNCGFRFIRPTQVFEGLNGFGFTVEAHECPLCRIRLVEVHQPFGTYVRAEPMDFESDHSYVVTGKVEL